jgi:hypothetical protein
MRRREWQARDEARRRNSYTNVHRGCGGAHDDSAAVRHNNRSDDTLWIVASLLSDRLTSLERRPRGTYW